MSIILPSRKVLTKGRIAGRPFQYNPSVFRQSLGAEYNMTSAPGASYPRIGYKAGKPQYIDIELYLNAMGWNATEDTRADYIEGWITFLNSLVPQPSGRLFSPPPVVEFAFGTFVKKTRIEDMDIEQIRFTSQLRPLEIKVALKLLIIS